MGDRTCKKCRETIHSKARVCPHCRSRQGWTTGAKLGLAVMGLFVFGPLFVDSDTNARPSRQAPQSAVAPATSNQAAVSANPQPVQPGRDYDVQVVSKAPGSAGSVKFFMHGFGRDHEEAPLGYIPNGTKLTAVGWKCGDGGRFRTGPATPYFRVQYSGKSGWINARNTKEGGVGLLNPAECREFFTGRFPGLLKKQ